MPLNRLWLLNMKKYSLCFYSGMSRRRSKGLQARGCRRGLLGGLSREWLESRGSGWQTGQSSWLPPKTSTSLSQKMRSSSSMAFRSPISNVSPHNWQNLEPDLHSPLKKQAVPHHYRYTPPALILTLSNFIIISYHRTMSNTYLDDFMDKMITVPNDINRYLRLIRKLDKRVEDLQASLNTLQAKFLAQVKQIRDRKGAELPPQLKSDYQVISRKQKELFGYAKEKKEIADQLYSEVKEYQQMLATQLKNKYKQKPQEEILKRKKMKLDASKFSAPNKKEDFYYDSKEPQYCYCGGASFGEMVACENPYCEREWFHTTCIEEKNLPEKWYCSDCQKQREKTRNPTSRGYFVNKDGSAA